MSAPTAPSAGSASPAGAGNEETSSAQADALASSNGIAAEAMALFPDLFSKFATEVQSKDKKTRRKTLTMDQGQFKKVLKHLKLLPDRVSQSMASGLFTQSVEPGKSQLNAEAFNEAMVKLLATIQAKQETTLPVIPGALAEQAGIGMASTTTHVSHRTKQITVSSKRGKSPRSSEITKEVQGEHTMKVQQNDDSIGGLGASDSTRDARAFAAAATASIAAEKQKMDLEDKHAQEKARTDRIHAAGAEGNAAVEGQLRILNVCRFLGLCCQTEAGGS